ncbi:MAG: hypothetical protein ACTHXA_01765 [Gulosibacter sp.]|uniref:hypothetical protein n=1 Tax=Gulosibacter sp. TaxID=2817531 RepID=UPI003F93D7E2
MRKALALMPLIVLTLTGCSNASEVECASPPADAGERIADGANDFPIEAGVTAAVMHPTEADVMIIAMDFTLIDGTEATGVWGYIDRGGSVTILAIDGVAQAATDWPGQMNGHEFSVTEPGVSDALACLD